MTLANEYWFGASAGFYNGVINQSLRFAYGNASHLSRTPSSAGNRKTFTISFWTKRANISTPTPFLFDAYNASTENSFLRFNTDDTLRFSNEIGSSIITTVTTSQVFRDTTNWYHIVLAVDTTQSTASNRVKMYVNGEQITSFSATDYPSLNENTSFNNTVQHAISRAIEYSRYYDGYMAEVNFIDGSFLTPSSFGETKNGVWIPKAISGLTYGTNGYRLTFADSSSLGDDTSGNGNDYSSSGLASSYVVLDSPENNFATLNFLAGSTEQAASLGNLRTTASSSGANFSSNRSTIGVKSGKWYAEFRLDVVQLGIGGQDNGTFVGTGSKEYAHNNSNQNGTDNGVTILYTANASSSSRGIYVDGTLFDSGLDAHSAGDIIGIEMNVDDSQVTFYKNGTKQGNTRGIGSSIDGGFYYFYTYVRVQTANTQITANFGQDSTFVGQETAGTNTDANGIGLFKYAPSSGYLALCSSNLSDTTISPNQSEQADDHFNTVLWTGDDTTPRTITGVGFQPDWIWHKPRSSNTGYSQNHWAVDSSRGSGSNSLLTLYPNITNVEFDATGSGGNLTAITSDGFTITAGTSQNKNRNNNGETFVAWNWKAGGTTPTKTYKVVVVSDSGNKYRFRNSADSATFAQSAVTLDLQEGGTYVFDWSDSTAQGHPIRFSTTSDGTHGGGSEYTTGVVKDDSAYTTTITVASSAPQLYYYCSIHSGMGGSVNTNTTHGSTNFDGSILSVVQTNSDAQFSIIKGTTVNVQANDMTETFGHGLSGTPDYVIVKARDASNIWAVWTSAISINNLQGLQFNTNGGLYTNSLYKTVQATSSVVQIGRQAVENNGTTFVCYAFKEVEGYSKFGSYTGNGSTDGSYIFTSFRPSFIMIKRTDASDEWAMHDNKRPTYNPANLRLIANSSGAELSTQAIDLTSNGFKVRSSSSSHNQSGGTYIYMAFAEQPFKFSNAR